MRALRLAAELLLALLLYGAASAALTWPTAGWPNTIVVGGGELGGWLWRYWWHFQEARAVSQLDAPLLERVLDLLSLGRYPETGNILDVLFLSWPLSRFLDFPAHYNVKVLGILTLDGLAGYALARSYTESRLLALAAGLVAVVNPLTIQDVNGSGLRQVVLWWVLLYPIFLRRAARGQRFADALAAGVLWGLAAAWYWFYGMFLGLFTALYLGWRLFVDRASWRGSLSWVFVTGLAALLLALPFVRPYLSGNEYGAQLPEMTFFLPFPRYETVAQAPLRPENYADNVLASLHRTIRASWAADWIYWPFSYRSLPFSVVLLGVLPALLSRRRGFWLLVLGTFYVLSLGPFLKLHSADEASKVLLLHLWGSDWVVRLPYTWAFRWIPGISRLFAPYRFAAMVVVASVVLLASGLDALTLRARRRQGLLRLGALLGVTAATFFQVFFRFDVNEVPEGAFQPSRWRLPIRVSRIVVPDFYREIDPERMEGIIELPLFHQQDLLCYYQVVHHQKVYRSWATMGALPPFLLHGGGGEVGERLRYLARQLPLSFPGAATLEALSLHPEEVAVADIHPPELATLATAGSFRYLVVHERGYYLVDPQKGPLLYRAAVDRLAAALGIQADERLEHRWIDYPGNRYNVPGGPVYIPWSSEEIRLPDREMPRKLYMAIFDLSPLVGESEGGAEPAQEAPPGGRPRGGDTAGEEAPAAASTR